MVPNEAVATPPTHTHCVTSFVLAWASLCGNTPHLTRATCGLPTHACGQEQAVGRLSLRRLPGRAGAINSEAITCSRGSGGSRSKSFLSPLHSTSSPVLQPCRPAPCSTLRGCLPAQPRKENSRAEAKHGSGAGAGAPRAVLQRLLSCAAAARRWCTSQPEP